MLHNQERDPEVNLKTILGSYDLVLDLRPTDKSKHVGDTDHFIHKARTDG